MDLLQAVPSTLSAGSNNAIYSCTLTNNWLEANHPKDYPSRNAHWSPPVLASHNGDYEMWAPGGKATKGVENVAEVRCNICHCSFGI